MTNIPFTAAMALVLLLLPLTATCQPKAHNLQQPDEQPTAETIVETIYASQQCGRSQNTPSATWIDNAQQLETGIKRIRGTTPGGNPLPLPEPDFQREIALLVEMGQRPTLGYQIRLTGTGDLRIVHGQARLTLNWTHPPADAMVAQMISSPCLLLKLERGDYTSVQILDRQGTIKVSAH